MAIMCQSPRKVLRKWDLEIFFFHRLRSVLLSSVASIYSKGQMALAQIGNSAEISVANQIIIVFPTQSIPFDAS